MLKNTPVLLYVVACFLSVIALIIDSEWLLLLTKPMIIPALVIYYFSCEKSYFSFHLLLVLFIYFVSDALTLIKMPNLEVYNLMIDFIPYLLLARIGLMDSIRIGYQNTNFRISLLVYAALIILMIFILQSLNKESSEYSLAIMLYGGVLAIFISSGVYNYLCKPTDFTMFILVGACFSLIADIVYIVNQMIYFVTTFEYIEFVFQIISYFFIVVYFVRRNVAVFKNQEIYL